MPSERRLVNHNLTRLKGLGRGGRAFPLGRPMWQVRALAGSLLFLHPAPEFLAEVYNLLKELLLLCFVAPDVPGQVFPTLLVISPTFLVEFGKLDQLVDSPVAGVPFRHDFILPGAGPPIYFFRISGSGSRSAFMR